MDNTQTNRHTNNWIYTAYSIAQSLFWNLAELVNFILQVKLPKNRLKPQAQHMTWIPAYQPSGQDTHRGLLCIGPFHTNLYMHSS